MTRTKRKRHLMDIPQDIVFHILSRLPVTSLCCIRCVSKALLHIVDDLFFISLHTARLITTTNPAADDHHVPRLMFLALPSGRAGIFFASQSLKYDGSTGALTKGKYTVRVTSSDQSDRVVYHIYFVYCNLFFLKNALRQDCFLLNPFREGEILRLPRSTITGNRRILPCVDLFGMGFDSTTNTHKLLRVSWISGSERSYLVVAQVLVLGTGSWREISSVPPSCLNFVRHVCANGDMHWLVSGSTRKGDEGTSHIISLDFKKEEFYMIHHPNLHSTNKHPHNFHLLTLRGSMAILDASLSRPGGMDMNISIWVLKDYDKKQWSRDYTIEIKKLESQPEFGFKNATCGEWEHGIFYKDGMYGNTVLFLDLRCAAANRVVCPDESRDYTNMFSYTRSLISQKDYASFASDELITEGLKTYGNSIEGEEQGFRVSDKHMLRGTSFI